MRSLSTRRITFLFIFIQSLILCNSALAADKKGQFAIRGGGLLTCDIYLYEKTLKSQLYFMTAAWIDGYISASNQFMLDTYDIMSFEKTELLTAVIGEHCKKNPSDTIFAVINNLNGKLKSDRLINKSEKRDIIAGERKITLYIKTLTNMQKVLSELGYYSGEINADYNESTIKALKAYQESINFEVTGFPDQMTLWRLFRTI